VTFRLQWTVVRLVLLAMLSVKSLVAQLLKRPSELMILVGPRLLKLTLLVAAQKLAVVSQV
jgi:hypothetical protein